MSTIKRGVRVEWRSLGEKRPFVWFKGVVTDVPTEGKWLGVALIKEDGRTARHVDITRLVVSTSQARSTPLGGEYA